MASQHIEIPSTASRHSADVRAFIDNLRAVQAQHTKVKDIMAQVASGTDWASLATKLGVTEAEAEAVYNLIVALDLDTYGINAVIDRLG